MKKKKPENEMRRFPSFKRQEDFNRLIVEAILEQQKMGQINPVLIKKLTSSVGLHWCEYCQDFFDNEHECFREE